jgi:hypothetical protein
MPSGKGVGGSTYCGWRFKDTRRLMSRLQSILLGYPPFKIHYQALAAAMTYDLLVVCFNHTAFTLSRVWQGLAPLLFFYPLLL